MHAGTHTRTRARAHSHTHSHNDRMGGGVGRRKENRCYQNTVWKDAFLSIRFPTFLSYIYCWQFLDCLSHVFSVGILHLPFYPSDLSFSGRGRGCVHCWQSLDFIVHIFHGLLSLSYADFCASDSTCSWRQPLPLFQVLARWCSHILRRLIAVSWTKPVTLLVAQVDGGGGYFLACEDFGERFDESFPA